MTEISSPEHFSEHPERPESQPEAGLALLALQSATSAETVPEPDKSSIALNTRAHNFLYRIFEDERVGQLSQAAAEDLAKHLMAVRMRLLARRQVDKPTRSILLSVQDRSDQEVADQEGISLAALNARRRQAVNMLRDRLSKDERSLLLQLALDAMPHPVEPRKQEPVITERPRRKPVVKAKKDRSATISKAGSEELEEADEDFDELPSDVPLDAVYINRLKAKKLKLLTAEEEVELAKTIEAGVFAQEKLDISQDLPATLRHELELLVQMGKQAEERMVETNLRLVINTATHYRRRGSQVPFLDLIQEGNIGLMRAVKGFDYQRGYKFSTYALWWINQAMSRSISTINEIHLPINVIEKINQLNRVEKLLGDQLQRVPTTAELAVAMSESEETIIKLQQARTIQPVSLQTPIGEAETETLAGIIVDADVPDPYDVVTADIRDKLLHQVLDVLPGDRIPTVLSMRYGFLDGTVYTYEQIGERLGLSREMARRLDKQALSLLREQPEIIELFKLLSDGLEDEAQEEITWEYGL